MCAFILFVSGRSQCTISSNKFEKHEFITATVGFFFFFFSTRIFKFWAVTENCNINYLIHLGDCLLCSVLTRLKNVVKNRDYILSFRFQERAEVA